MNPQELRRRAAELIAEAGRQIEAVEGSDEAPTAEQNARHDELVEQASALAAQADEIEGRALRRAAVAASLNQAGPGVPQPHTDPRNTRGDRHVYSFSRAINGMLNQIEGRGRLDGLELEVHQTLVAQRGRPSAGLVVPLDAPITGREAPQRRDLSTSTGAGAIQTTVAPTMIDILRARMVLSQLGAQVLTFSSPTSLPRTTATVTVGTPASEGTNVAASNPTIGDIDLTIKSLEATTVLTRQFLASTPIAADRYITDQLTRTLAGELENQCFNGAGTAGLVKGLFKHTALDDGINVKALGANGAAPTFAHLVEMTGLIDTANAPDDDRAWLFNPTVVAFLQSTPKIADFPVYILGDSGTVAAYPYASTSRVPNNLTKGSGTGLSAAAFGSWGEMLLNLFSGADLYLDPYSKQPHVRVTVAQDFDMQLAHAASFAIAVDVKTS